MQMLWLCIVVLGMPSPSEACNEDWQTDPDETGCYRIFEGTQTWEQCQATCIENDASLVCVQSKKHNDFIFNLAGGRDGGGVWIGIRQEGSHTASWCTVSGCTSDYQNWADNEPNTEHEHCVMMYRDFNGQWADGTCSGDEWTPRSCLCELSFRQSSESPVCFSRPVGSAVSPNGKWGQAVFVSLMVVLMS
eukprot:gnl/TRDRNA2_/TRDRNA2_209013_c0_seq1.p1 gnl/TRDRNA2_/TRDRNA2_209013_c0~~gnl/TRDRNA2_/TRDRNA2_209013_c0_seq1.p1  ORF type:complete len:191 (+),score=16.55 gnl/TRDRNA2_/TRDRNA2_209013_c0_seq1:118-690(+)